ncbi:hypothetical protein PIGHUM_02604 [Pigmentiphaga humi]|uniref:Glutamine cyclotransferase n=1 Tax=Pigmentiphaga humi TaxID=2478468 RepID=A0A3P4B3B3_9BURK|nr:glutamine cyclotransferase [Pigmentiphaga humi]VCU70532.1 hypothetical protein PIGHUM_02604 [Pigmentiphaga humi]
MNTFQAHIVREYGPFPGAEAIHGVSYDGRLVWFATGEKLQALDPASGEVVRTIDVAARAGTAYDGRHLFQLADGRINKIDPGTGGVIATIASPAGEDSSGLAWAEGSLWVGHYKARRILQLDPETGTLLRVIAAERFVTGVTWVDGQLWHGTWEDGASDLRRLDPASGEVQEVVGMPSGTGVSGLESDGADLFFCGGGESGKLRTVRRPRGAARADVNRS